MAMRYKWVARYEHPNPGRGGEGVETNTLHSINLNLEVCGVITKTYAVVIASLISRKSCSDADQA